MLENNENIRQEYEAYEHLEYGIGEKELFDMYDISDDFELLDDFYGFNGSSSNHIK